MPEGQDLEISRPWPFSALAPLLGGKSLRQIVLFLIVGVSNTILTYVVYLALLRVAHYAWAFTGAFVVGLVFTGLLNIRVTFSHHPTVAACVVFSAYYGLYYVFALALLHVFVDWLGIDEHYAPILMLPIVVPINFVMTKFIVHRFGRALTYEGKMLEELRALQKKLQAKKRREFNRRVSLGDLLTERSDNAREMGFGVGTTCYDNVLILGDVEVGRNTWIGPNVILDGSGGKLVIGDYCSISAGAQIYTHNTVAWSTSLGEQPIAKAPTRIGNGVYIGPNSVVAMGVTIGDKAVIGALSLVNDDIPAGARAWGTPARVVG